MIIPYGHEKSTVRRMPWVTFALIGLCVIAFIPTNMAVEDDGQAEVVTRMRDVLVYLSSHPYLKMDPRFEEFLRDRLSPRDVEQLQTSLEAIKHIGGSPPESSRALRDEQEGLERRVDLLLAASQKIRGSPFYRWGLIPAHFKAYALITYQFLHGGFWHLLFNMLFLFLAAPFIEDVWGRPLFAVFFLVAGAVSGLMYAVHYPTFEGPLIGASGAVAGVMGAFLVRGWSTRIRFLYWFFPVRPLYGSFTSPAWVMLPLWFLRELFYAQGNDVLAGTPGGGGVAHWAHVWGFACGLAVASAMVYFKIEERFIHPAIESKVTVLDNASVEEAMQARAEGRLEEAASRLRLELRDHPDNVDATLAWWSMATASGAVAEVVPHLLRAIRRAVVGDDPSLVLAHWHELLQAQPALELDPQLGARVAEILHDHGHDDGVAGTLTAAARGLRPTTPAGVLARLARLGAATGHEATAAFLAAAMAAPDLPEEVRAELEALGPASPVPLEPVPPAERVEQEVEMASPVSAPRSLQAMEAIPEALQEDVLTIQVRGTTRRLALSQIQAIAVAGVQRPPQRPVLVVDLLLDPPWAERQTLRSLRLLSTTFDPRRVVGAGDVMTAFRDLLGRLLEISGAVPLPDPDAARGQPFRTFSSFDEYHRQVLGIDAG